MTLVRLHEWTVHKILIVIKASLSNQNYKLTQNLMMASITMMLIVEKF